MKRACKLLTSKNMGMSACEFQATIKNKSFTYENE
jgi:hypothetical protein